MPIRGKGGRKGDMYVRFEVEFPTTEWAKGLELGDGETKVDLPGRKPDLAIEESKLERRELSAKPIN